MMNVTEAVSCKVPLIVFVSRDIIRLLGSFALLWGIIKFHCFVNRNGNKNLVDVMTTVKKCRYNDKKTCVLWTFMFGIIFIISMSVTIIPFTFVFRTDIKLQSPETWYYILDYPAFLVDILKVLFMLAVTLIVKAKWSTKYEPQGETIQQKFESLIEHYTHTGNIVCKLQNIFKYWFILNWMTFFINMAFNALTALKSLMSDKQTGSVGLWIYALLLLFDSFVFFLPYICGNAMIDYHVKYLSALKEKQRVIFSDAAAISQNVQCFWMFQYANIIPQRREYQFIPSIMWVEVPLDSPGYVLSILLALFSLLTHFID